MADSGNIPSSVTPPTARLKPGTTIVTARLKPGTTTRGRGARRRASVQVRCCV